MAFSTIRLTHVIRRNPERAVMGTRGNVIPTGAGPMISAHDIKLALYSLSLFMLAGCSSFLRSNVVTFHEGPLPTGETIKVVASDPARQQSLEYRSYANLVSAELAKIGFSTVSGDEDARLLAELDYSVELGPTTISVERPDRFVRYHFYYGRYYDPFYFGIYNRWGPEVITTPSYLRTLQLNIVSNDAERTRLFEGRVQSSGKQNQLPQIMPYLITAMFANYPGESGVTKVVTIEMDE